MHCVADVQATRNNYSEGRFWRELNCVIVRFRLCAMLGPSTLHNNMSIVVKHSCFLGSTKEPVAFYCNNPSQFQWYRTVYCYYFMYCACSHSFISWRRSALLYCGFGILLFGYPGPVGDGTATSPKHRVLLLPSAERDEASTLSRPHFIPSCPFAISVFSHSCDRTDRWCAYIGWISGLGPLSCHWEARKHELRVNCCSHVRFSDVVQHQHSSQLKRLFIKQRKIERSYR